MARASVDLPEPDSPTTASVCPGWMSTETSFSTLTRAAAIGSGDVLDRQHRLAPWASSRGGSMWCTETSALVYSWRGSLMIWRGAAPFDQPAVPQHHDLVGDLRHHGEVVGDVEGGDAGVADRVLDGRQHVDLGGDVERGGRLVEDDQVGLGAQRHGGHRALQLAAGDLVREALAEIFRIGQAELPEQGDGPSSRPRRAWRRRARARPRPPGPSAGAPD